MDLKEFENLVTGALNNLPEEYGKKLANVDIVVENEPDMDTARALGLGTKGRLLGLYQGVPLKERTHYYGMVLPDKITLYKSNIEKTCLQQGLDVYDEIKHVLQHEIAHHFGISDQHMKDLGAY